MAKTAIVTGASRGIGREIARALAASGHRVLALARSEDKLMKLHQSHPEHIFYRSVDLTQSDQLNELENWLEKESSSIDILINNAGGLIAKPFMDLSEAEWQQMFDVNVMTIIRLTKLVIPFLNDPSHVVNISSMGGFQGSAKFPGLTAYSVAKGAVSILSECLAVELTEQNIRVNALCLGSVQTEMFSQAFPDFEADIEPEQMGTYIANFALNDSTFYNGRVLPVALSDPS